MGTSKAARLASLIPQSGMSPAERDIQQSSLRLRELVLSFVEGEQVHLRGVKASLAKKLPPFF
jgi:hypothetical protein